jgi:hypothetical protein
VCFAGHVYTLTPSIVVDTLDAGSLLRFKIRKFKTEGFFTSWAKKQVTAPFIMLPLPPLSRHGVCSRAASATALNFFKA